jgi:PAS domain S-box-containing protein
MAIRILIVDDDRDLLRLVDRFLAKKHPEFEIIFTVSAQDAIRRLEEDNYDAIVCDYYLGLDEMNGLELLEWLRGSGNEMPFVMFTGKSREEVAIRALNLGANFYLKKDMEDFASLFEELAHHIKSSVEIQQMEERIAASEEQFRAMFEHAPIGVSLVELDGTISKGNESLAKMLGYSIEELKEINAFEITVLDDERVERQLSRELVNGKRDAYSMEKRYIRKDGEMIWGRLSVSVVRDRQSKPIFTIGMVEDITSEKETLKALTESESRFRAMFEGAGIGIAITTEDDRILDVNPALEELLGYSRDELLSMRVYDFSHPDDHERDNELFRKIADSENDTYSMQKRYIKKDGSQIWTNLSVSIVRDDNGELKFMLGMVQDITERRKAEKALKESEEKYRTLIEYSPEGLVVVTGDSLKIVYTNPAFSKIFGYSTEEVHSLSIYDLQEMIHPDDFDQAIQIIMERFDGKPQITGYEIRATRKDGKMIWIDGWATKIQYEGNEALQVYITDITQRKETQLELEKSKERYQLLIERMPDGLSEMDENDIITFVNPRLSEIWMYSESELVGETLVKFLNDEGKEIYKVQSEKRRDGISDPYELPLKRKDGTIILTKVSPQPIFNDNEEYLGSVAVITDITKIKKAENTLKESEVKFRSIFEDSPVAFELFDSEGNLLDANNACLKLFGAESLEDFKQFNLFQDPNLPDDRHQALLNGEIIYIETSFDFDLVREHNLYSTYKSGKAFFKVVATPFSVKQSDKPNGYLVQLLDVTDRKLMLDKLRQSEERYRELAEKSLLGIAVFQDGKIVYANQKAADIAERPLEEYLEWDTMEWAQYIYPDDMEMVLESYSNRMEGKDVPSDYEFRVVKPDEDISWIHMFASDIIWDGQPATQALILDITETKKAEQALETSESQFRAIVENAIVGVFRTKINGEILYVNDALATILGYDSPSEIISTNVSVYYLNANRRKDLVVTLNNEGYVDNYVFEAKCKDGTEITISSSMSLINGEIIGISKDITQHRKMEEALRTSEERFRRIFDESPVAIEIYDENGKLVMSNKSCWELFGIDDGEQIKGFNLWKNPNFPEEARNKIQHGDTIRFENKFDFSEVHKFSLYETSKSGIVYLDIVALPLYFDEKGKPIGYMLQMLDITARKKSERELQDNEKRLRIAGKLAYDLIYEWDVRSDSLKWFGDIDGILGYEKGEISQNIQTWLSLIYKEDRAILNDAVELHRTATEPIDYEYRIRTKDGTIRYWEDHALPLLDDKGKPYKWIGVCTDVTKQKIAEIVLKKSEERHRTLVNSIPDIIYVIDVYDRFLEYYGATDHPLRKFKEDIIGKTVRDVFPPNAAELYIDSAQKVRVSKQKQQFDYALKIDDNLYWFMTTITLHEDGESVVALIHDITQRKQMERALGESEEKYRAVVDQSVQGIAIHLLEEFQIVYTNPSLSKILGHSIEEMEEFTKEHILGIIHPEDRDSFTEILKQLLESRETPSWIEFRSLKSDGTTIWIQLNARRIQYQGKPAILATYLDITEQKVSEKKLEESERRYRLLFDTSLNGITFTDMEGRFLEVNQAYLDLTGYSMQELKQLTYHDITPKKWQTLENEIHESQVLTRGYSDEYEKEIIRKDGIINPVNIRTWLIPDELGEPLHIVAVVQDITEKKRVEKELRESEEKYRSFVESFQGISFKGFHDFSADFFTGKVEETTGYTEKDFNSGKIRYDELIVSEDAQDILESIDEFMSSSRITDQREYRIKDKNGKIHWIQENIQKIDPNDISLGVYGTLVDITKRKKAVQALKESEERFRALVENLHIIVQIVDSYGNISYLNPAVEQILGYKPEELIGETSIKIVHPDDISIVEKDFQRVIENSKEPVVTVCRCQHKDGSWHILEGIGMNFLDNPAINGFLAILRDITEQRRAQEKLRESEEKYRGLVEASPDAIFMSDLQGIIKMTNIRGVELYGGKSEDELIGSNSFDWIVPEDHEEALRNLKKTLEQGYAHNLSYTIARKDGSEIPVEMNTAVIYDIDNEPEGFVAIVRDITEKRASEDELREKKEQLVERVKELKCLYDLDHLLGNTENITDSLHQITSLIANSFLWPDSACVKITLHEKSYMNRDYIDSDYSLSSTITCFDHKIGSIEVSYMEDKPEEDIGPFLEEEKGLLDSISYHISDFSEKEQIRSNQHEISERYRAMFELSPQIITYVDLDGNLVSCNAALERLTGYPLKEIENKHFSELEFLYNEDVNLYVERFDEILNGKMIEPFETRYRTKDGESRIVEVHVGILRVEGEIIGFQAIANDITKRKRGEEALLQSEEKYRTLVNSIVDMIFIIDENNHVSSYYGHGDTQIVDMIDDVVDKEFSEYLPDDIVNQYKEISEEVRTSGTTRMIEVPIQINNVERWFSVNLSLHQDGKTIVAVTRDITDRQIAYENLMRQKEELSEFAHALQHDFINYLFKIQGLSELLEAEYRQDDIESLQYLVIEMRDLLKHSVALADAGLEIEIEKNINLNELFQKIALNHIPSNIEYEQESLPLVDADPTKLSQIIQNIFNNAVVHGNPDVIEVKFSETEDARVLAIINDGKPIPADMQKRIFQRGFSSVEGRSGFGLAIVQKLVEAHGWEIRLANKPQTTFEIVIPKTIKYGV